MVEGPRIEPVRLPALDPADEVSFVGRIHSELHAAGLDLASVSFQDQRISECWFERCVLDDAVLTGVHLFDSVLSACTATSLAAASSRWRDVEIAESRLGAVELYDAHLRSVHFVGCRLGYLNLRGADLADLRFTDCRIEDLDLTDATVSRVALAGSTVETLSTSRATLSDLDLRGARLSTIVGVGDLRGAVIDAGQLTEFAPLLAAEAGLVVAEG